MADLGPGTMPRGKYPESPAPAGSHALISRTPTPGGMLHANLGLPRPPPRNFQPPLPQPPSNKRKRIPQTKNLLACPAAGRGAVTLWRHACLTTPVVKPSPPQTPSVQTATTPPHKTKNPSCCRSRGGCGCLAGPPANTYPRNKPSKQTATTPPHKTKNPSCRHSVAACVSDHSRGQALAPATSPQNKQQQHPPSKPKSALILVASLQRHDGAEWALLRPPRAAD